MDRTTSVRDGIAQHLPPRQRSAPRTGVAADTHGVNVVFDLANESAAWRACDYEIVRSDRGLTVVYMSGQAVLAPGTTRRVSADITVTGPSAVEDLQVRVADHLEPVPHQATARPFTVSVVIPALNEELGIARVLQEVPVGALNEMGYDVEILVVDNGSTDQTKRIARDHGVTVIVQPIRGYGNAYKAGFANATGDIIVTGDADCTYPFDALPSMLQRLEADGLDFVNTDRLSGLQDGVMSRSHRFGNWFLTAVTKTLFRWPFHDSQSGMWVFRSDILPHLHVRSAGMPFSQEVKIRAHQQGFKCAEIPIEYRARAGQEKLNTVRDGIRNITHLVAMRLSG